MKSIIIPYSDRLELPDEKTLSVDIYKWVDNSYRPKVDVYLCHNNKKLKIKIVSYEKHDDVGIKYNKDNQAVYCDSCVEFFIKPYSDNRYVNFEINPSGAMIMSLNKEKGDSKVLVFKYKPILNLITNQTPYLWYAQFEIPFESLAEIYEQSNSIQSGDKIRGNFYKCGDETKYPHYGMWNEIPDGCVSFHQPEYFGELILE